MFHEFCRTNQRNPSYNERKSPNKKNQRVTSASRAGDMDILHAQLAAIQRKLAFVQVDPIDWRTYVLVFSSGICLFESYLLYVPWSRYVPPFPQTLTVPNPII